MAKVELRIYSFTVEEGVCSKHRRQSPAVDTEPVDRTEQTHAHFGIHNPDQDLPVIPGIAARQSGLGGDCRDIATDMRQTIPCVEIRCGRDGSCFCGRAAVMV